MQEETPYFVNRTIRQTFFVLFAGILGIIVASLFVYDAYLTATKSLHFRRQAAHQVIRVLKLATSVPPGVLPSLLANARSPMVSAHISQRPISGARPLTDLTPAKIRQIVNTHPGRARFALPLADGRWLNLQTQNLRIKHWLFAIITLSAVLLLFVLFVLCLWTIKRLAIPLGDFSGAAKRLGDDVNAPPMAETGSTEMREAAHAFNQMQSRIRRLLNDRTQMLAAISHDLRTPITRLKLRAESLDGTPQYDKILGDLDEMETMIASVLAFAREDTHAEPMERFDLEALIDSLCDDMQSAGRAVTFQGTEAGRMPFYGRSNALRRALSNLIDNAIKYGKQARVSLVQTADTATIHVEDQGPGIPEAELERVFSPFYRVEAARSPAIKGGGGAGLGLSIAREIVRTHGGDITLSNLAPSRGLRVTITLPVMTP